MLRVPILAAAVAVLMTVPLTPEKSRDLRTRRDPTGHLTSKPSRKPVQTDAEDERAPWRSRLSSIRRSSMTTTP